MTKLLAWFFLSSAHAANPAVQLPTTPVNSVSSLANHIVGILLAFSYPLAFAGLLYSSFLLIKSAGNPDGMAKAKKNLTYLVIGIFLIVLAVTLVRFVGKLIDLPTI